MGICENCKQSKKTQWANISGEYKRELNDWAELCAACHALIDGGRGRKRLLVRLKCLVDNCEKSSRALRLCQQHYDLQRRG